MKLNLVKMSGAGNTFLVADFRRVDICTAFNEIFGEDRRAEAAKTLCQSDSDWASDGLVILLGKREDPNNDFSWDFYNADGSNAEMCGNAARCVAQYVHDEGPAKSKYSFETRAGVIEAEILEAGQVTVGMTPIRHENWDQQIEVGPGPVNYNFLDTGVPHVVIEREDIFAESWGPLAEKIKLHDEFQPGSTNVTFYQPTDSDKINALTYERGVEGYTQACGTGAVAAAASHAYQTKKLVQEVTVPGGVLIVDLSNARPFLTGPADELGRFELSKEDVL